MDSDVILCRVIAGMVSVMRKTSCFGGWEDGVKQVGNVGLICVMRDEVGW